MVSSRSTTLVVVGHESAKTLEALDHLTNVRAATLSHRSDAEAQRWVAQSQAPYVVHDRDPLGHVAAAWVEFFDDMSTLGTLDLEVDRALDALRSGEANMPDYYIVVDPQELPPTWKHWWLGVLPQAAPSRVIPWDDGSIPLGRVLRQLPTGRGWPSPDPWLRKVSRSVPDRVGIDGRDDLSED